MVSGEFGELTVDQLEQFFHPSSRGPDWTFAVDLTECTYIDSMGISTLVLLGRRLGTHFEVRIRAHGLVHHVFEICGFISTRTFVKIVRTGEEGPGNG